MARFAADADIPLSLANLLATGGHDAVAARQVGLASASDDKHLLIAAEQSRILITHNERDFLLLHRAWLRWPAAWGVQPLPRHAGILVLPQGAAARYCPSTPVMRLGTWPHSAILNWMGSSQWRKTMVDWHSLYCPNRYCPYYGQPFPQARLVKNGTTRGQAQARCGACRRTISVNYGTAYFQLDTDPAVFETAVRALAEGNSLRSTGRIVQVDKDTACAWLDRAARHCRLVMLSLWRQLPVTECQLDELWSFVHTKERNLATAKQVCATYGDAWVWVAFAPVWRLVVAFVVGKRNQAGANLLLERVAQVSDAQVPFFTSDQLAEYRTALLHTYGVWHRPARRGSRGRFPQPRRVPHPDLLYAQVVKQRDRGRVVAVTSQVVFGEAAAIQARLASLPTSTTINTSFVERDNLSLRQHNRRLTRETNGFSKELTWLEKQLWLALAYYHLVLPHESLAEELLVPAPTRGSGSARRWCPITPAMAAGMTDHVWTTAELLSYRVPATFLDRLHEIEHLFPPLDEVHHGS